MYIWLILCMWTLRRYPCAFKTSIASMKLFKWKIKNKLTAISFSFSFSLWNYGSYTHQQKFLGHHDYYHYIAEQCWVEKGLEGQVIRFFAEFCLCKILFAKTLWENCWRHKGLLSLYGTGSSKMFKRRERWFLSKMKIAFLSYKDNVYIYSCKKIDTSDTICWNINNRKWSFSYV